MIKKLIIGVALAICTMAVGASEFYEGGKSAYNAVKDYIHSKNEVDTKERTEEVTEESE